MLKVSVLWLRLNKMFLTANTSNMLRSDRLTSASDVIWRIAEHFRYIFNSLVILGVRQMVASARIHNRILPLPRGKYP